MNQAYLTKKIILLCLSALLLIFFLLIANPDGYFFLNDDFIHIPLAAKGDFLQGSFYRPLSNLSIWLDSKLWGYNSAGYHLSNVLIHLINTFLVFLAGRKIFSLNSSTEIGNLKAILSALLFLVYANHSEPIFWIIGRGGSLVTLFFLLAFLFYLESWSSSLLYYLISLILFLAGLFVYEIIWCFPAFIALFSINFARERKQYWKILGVVIVFVFFLLLKFVVTGRLSGSYELGALNSFKIQTLFYNFNTLVARSFLPPMKSGIVLLALYLTLLFCVSAILIRLRKNSRMLLVLFCCVGLSVLPVVTLGIDTHDSESERFIYLATVFAIFFIVDLLFQFRPYVVNIGFTLLVVFHSYEFAKTAETYRFSSMVTKKSLECLPISRGDAVIAVNVPTQYEGGLIFRTGLPEAIEWIRGLDKSNVHILNEKEISKKFPQLICKPVKSIILPNSPFKITDSIGLRLGVNKVFLKWEGDSLLFSREIL